MEVKITKRQLLRHDNNDMVTNWFYKVNGRIYNDSGDRYRSFRFVAWIDGDDLWFYDGDGKTDNEEDWTFVPLDEYLDYYAIPGFTNLIKSYDDTTAFYDACNESIEHWNDLVSRSPYWYC